MKFSLCTVLDDSVTISLSLPTAAADVVGMVTESSTKVCSLLAGTTCGGDEDVEL